MVIESLVLLVVGRQPPLWEPPGLRGTSRRRRIEVGVARSGQSPVSPGANPGRGLGLSVGPGVGPGVGIGVGVGVSVSVGAFATSGGARSNCTPLGDGVGGLFDARGSVGICISSGPGQAAADVAL